MNRITLILVPLVVAALTSYFTVKASLFPHQINAKIAPPETAYERIMRTGKIRCGYINHPPHLLKDPATGKISGISHDIMEEAGRLLKLDIEWKEEINWPTIVTAMQSGRIDSVCTNFWQNPEEAKYIGFSIPLFYSAVGAYARMDDTRFDVGLSAANHSDIKISTANGTMASIIAKQDFPLAQLISIPNLSAETQMLMDVQNYKSDITFVESYVAEDYIQNNPQTNLVNLIPDNPIRYFGNVIVIPHNDGRYKNMLDTTFTHILNSKYVEKTIQKYTKQRERSYPVSPIYETLK